MLQTSYGIRGQFIFVPAQVHYSCLAIRCSGLSTKESFQSLSIGTPTYRKHCSQVVTPWENGLVYCMRAGDI